AEAVAYEVLSLGIALERLAIVKDVVVSVAAVRFSVPPEALRRRRRADKLTVPLPLTAVAAEIVPAPERVPPGRVMPLVSVSTAPLSTARVPPVTVWGPLIVVLCAISSTLPLAARPETA